MTSLLYFLLAIGILVFIHEMGHYLAARQCGVKVLRFSVGFGRPLLTRVSARTGTEWVVAAIPLGGYVRMEDESFDGKTLLARSWIVAAGPLANLIFAALAYGVLFASDRTEPQSVLGAPVAGSPAQRAGLQAGDRVLAVDGRSVQSFTELRWRAAQSLIGEGLGEMQLRVERADGSVADVLLRMAAPAADVPAAAGQAPPAQTDPVIALRELGLVPQSKAVRVLRVQENSAAHAAGLRAGDTIVRVQGEPVAQPDAVISRVKASGGKPLELVVEDGDGPERVVVTPVAGADGVYRMGAVVGADVASVVVSDDPLTAGVKGVVRTWEMSLLTVQALGRMIMGEMSWRNISGPVSIAETAGESASVGWKAFVSFLGLISVSIAVLNLLPIPMLDGGHLLYYLWEFVRGRPLPAEVQEAGRRIGVALIMMLTAVALFNDFARLAGL
jgi:regulator of sigma E protease